MTTVKVWPNKRSAVGLKHPNGPDLSKDGSLWPLDGFTSRLLTEKSVTREEPEKVVEPEAEAAATPPGEAPADPPKAA